MGLGEKSRGWGKEIPVLPGQGWEAARGSAVLFVSCFVLTTLGVLRVIPQFLMVQEANLPVFKPNAKISQSHSQGKKAATSSSLVLPAWERGMCAGCMLGAWQCCV